MFSRAELGDIKISALEPLHRTLSHHGKVSLRDKTVGTMGYFGERASAFNWCLNLPSGSSMTSPSWPPMRPTWCLGSAGGMRWPTSRRSPSPLRTTRPCIGLALCLKSAGTGFAPSRFRCSAFPAHPTQACLPGAGALQTW